MAVFNEINVGRFNRYLQKLLQIKGGPPVPSLAGEINPAPSIDVETDTWDLQTWEQFFQYSSVAAGGIGTNRAAWLRNRVASGIIAIVDSIESANSGAALSAIPIMFKRSAVATDDQGILLTPPGLDNRARVQPMCRFTTGATALAGFIN